MARYIRINIADGIRVKSEEEVVNGLVDTIVSGASEIITSSLESALEGDASEKEDNLDTRTDNITVSDYLGDDEEEDDANVIDIDDMDWNTIVDS